jgi:hypothetical protein
MLKQLIFFLLLGLSTCSMFRRLHGIEHDSLRMHGVSVNFRRWGRRPVLSEIGFFTGTFGTIRFIAGMPP